MHSKAADDKHFISNVGVRLAVRLAAPGQLGGCCHRRRDFDSRSCCSDCDRLVACVPCASLKSKGAARLIILSSVRFMRLHVATLHCAPQIDREARSNRPNPLRTCATFFDSARRRRLFRRLRQRQRDPFGARSGAQGSFAALSLRSVEAAACSKEASGNAQRVDRAASVYGVTAVHDLTERNHQSDGDWQVVRCHRQCANWLAGGLENFSIRQLPSRVTEARHKRASSRWAATVASATRALLHGLAAIDNHRVPDDEGGRVRT